MLCKSNEFIKSKIRTVPDFPKQGIMFRDITTLLQDPEGLKTMVDIFYERYKDKKIDAIIGIEARGFILASVIAYKLGLGFVPIRKKGKLPAKTESQEYELEYGTDKIEIHADALKKGDKVIVVDDLLATGGTCLAAAKLVEKIGGVVEELAFIVNLPDIGGEKRLTEQNYNLFYLCEFEGD